METCIVYSFGVRNEASFEVELADRTRCVVYAHDPTVVGMPSAAQRHPNIRFAQLGLAEADSVGYQTLQSIMTSHGHKYVLRKARSNSARTDRFLNAA